jgi:transposase
LRSRARIDYDSSAVTAAEPNLESDAQMREELAALRAALAVAERERAKTAAQLVRVTAERDKLRRAYDLLAEQVQLLRRRIFQAKAERVDVAQLELEFHNKLEELRQLASKLEIEPPSEGADGPPSRARKPSGRRNLAEQDLPEERVEVLNPALEGVATRIGFEEHSHLGYRRGGPVRVVVARAKYKSETDGETTFVTADKPKELFRRGLLAPSLVAHILVAKYRFGLPFVRLSKMLASEGLVLDDGTMCRYAEDAGASVGAIVDAMAADARAHAFCLATDATGVAIRPAPLAAGQRQACDKGHFFVVLADRDHVFFEYKRRHTSDAVCEMFRGYGGYIVADAHCIYDALFRGDARVADNEKPPDEVACWSHARRRFWEAAVASKEVLAREALVRIRMMFELEAGWASLPPVERHRRRQTALRPLLDDFFTWAEPHYRQSAGTRGLLSSAFGYAFRQRDALRRFLDDGRLPMTNNASERALRGIAVGRKNWLFFGSDDHAQAAANLFSLMASCQLHGLDAEIYLAEIFRVLPYWPRDRYLELAPKSWAATRARLDERELALPISHITVPPLAAPEQQPAAG